MREEKLLEIFLNGNQQNTLIHQMHSMVYYLLLYIHDLVDDLQTKIFNSLLLFLLFLLLFNIFYYYYYYYDKRKINK